MSNSSARRYFWVTFIMVRLNVVICLCVNLIPFPVEANPHAKRLYDDLLSNYNRLIRPVSNNSEKLTVNLGLKLSQLIDVVRNYL